MKAAVLGIGRMGTAISYAMNTLGFDVIGVDSQPSAVDNFKKYVDNSSGIFYLIEDTPYKAIEEALRFEKPDVVISSLPYHQTEDIARWCIDNGMRYCDLGGRVDVSESINKYASLRSTKPVFTDLGLAPGWVNIMAEEGYRQVRNPTDINMYVGGLPQHPHQDNPLQYELTWSFDGLINEYVDDCEVLVDGEVVIRPGLEGQDQVMTKLGHLEAFYTSGGAAHSINSMAKRGVQNCAYRTLRYHGHRDIVRYLVRDCELDNEVLKNIFNGGKYQQQAGDDVVVMLATASNDELSWRKDNIVFSDDEFTAMQRATAFPISAVASLMANGRFDDRKVERRGYYETLPNVLTYADVPYGEFNQRIASLGL
jgi:saccharopine dehydrogenase-like NADP-dependent oxidoreductase